MKIIGFIEREETVRIRMVLSTAGLWKEPVPRTPPPGPVANSDLEPFAQDILIKITLPTSERLKVLSDLEQYNINSYTLFNSEESLAEYVSFLAFENNSQ